MFKSKLFVLIRNLKKEEHKRVRNFIVSPYFNRKPELVKLYDYIIRLYPNFPSKKLDRKEVYKELFPAKGYDEKEITYMMSSLSQLIERYLGQRQYEQAEGLVIIHQMDALSKRGLNKHYSYKSRKVNHPSIKKNVNNSNHYYEALRFAEIKNEFFVLNGGDTYDPNLQYAIDNLDRFYYSKRLKLICEVEDRNRLMTEVYRYSSRGELLAFIENSGLLKLPIIKAYYHVLNLFISDNPDEHFQDLMNFIDANLAVLPHSDRSNILNYGINYGARKMSTNINPDFFAKKCLKAYLHGIGKGVFFENSYLSSFHFRNVIMLGLNLKEFEATHLFIERYGDDLEPSERKDLLKYCLAELCYAQKNYDKALDHLREIAYNKDKYYQLDAKLMQTRIYFDKGEEDPLDSLLSSFRLFLTRNKKFPKKKIQASLNYCKLLMRIMRKNRANKEKIRADIEKKELLVNKRWLLEALEKSLSDEE